jgi:hypothetical protein
MNKAILSSLIAITTGLASPVSAGQYRPPGSLQWVTTQCQVQKGSDIIEYSTCNAGFASDTAVRAIKYTRKDGSKAYWEVNDPGVTFAGPNDRECLNINFTDGSTELLCTVKTPEQLGIIGD